ncbi:unnamed protein product [Allacma fusca]|uniref:Beta-galactosidase n=1 Tax=Allacma fusca TaxID=39272 RepID=A0A8J2JE70_9HEXA|nr:unnamed protein product [Allacma fusca]
MLKFALVATLLVLVQGSRNVPQDPNRADLPTVYEYFASNGFNTGLEVNNGSTLFSLNGKPLKIISGAIHYFRTHPDQWRDRLRKLRAAGANTVETYVAWNLHEPKKDEFDFGHGNNDMSVFLSVKKYIQMAQEEDLLVLFRPGPYICSEWDFGGLPSWLQRDPELKVRQYSAPYLERVEKFYQALLPQLVDLQFTRGGPIIGLQIENEYGSFDAVSKDYVQYLVDLVKSLGFNRTLLYTSDGVGNGDRGTLLDQLLYTANFQSNPEGNFDALLKLQPNKPTMAMEFWTGWFDHWFEDHSTVSTEAFGRNLEVILGEKYNGSVNFYMFHGGTNFGFLAGANSGNDAPGYYPDITSYDYDAPLTEAGDYGDKYAKAVEIIDKYELPKLSRPIRPAESTKKAYNPVTPNRYLSYADIIAQLPGEARSFVTNPTSMEDLNMNNGSGQSYGYLIHRKQVSTKNGSVLKAGPVKDFGFVLVDGVIQPSSFRGEGNDRYWINNEKEVSFENITEEWHNIDIFVENMARVNFGYAKDFLQKKGLPDGKVTLDGAPVQGFEVLALEFKTTWVNSLQNFRTTQNISALAAPLIVQSTFNVTGTPADTFINMAGWEKGIVLVNGFNLGRYWNVGPQQTLYVPSPILRTGQNTLTVFEQLKPGSQITFQETPNLGLHVERPVKTDYSPIKPNKNFNWGQL